MIGFHTIAQGQRVAVWDIRGKRTIIDGPQRLYLFNKRIEPLHAFSAGPTQYLVIKYHDGRIEHQRGPAIVWMDRVEHQEIRVADAVELDANEALVVYKQENPQITRRIVRGPAMFVPESDEWLHTFSWHGSVAGNNFRKLPHALKFTKLRVIPDQMYYDVEDVRTADDALMVVKLMVFFELDDIGTMLNATHDPIADFINAVSADVIDFASGVTFEQFKEQTEKLNNLDTYKQLIQRSQRIGYRIAKVVYRGYHANPKLQSMHDNAIESRTRLRLEAETERQAQELADLKLKREQDRSRMRQEMEQSDVEHQNRIKRTAHDEQLRHQQADRESELSGRRAANDEELRLQRAKEEISLTTQKASIELTQQQEISHYHEQSVFFQNLKQMQVDLTRYLVAQYQHPDRLIRIEGDNAGRLHLHEKD